MNRRGFLRGTLGAAGALVGALAVRTGVDGRESTPEGVQGQSVGGMTIVTGPDPDHYVNVAFRTDGTAIVLPPGAPLLSPESVDRWMGIERAVFPESDPKHGAVTIFDAASIFVPPDEWTVPMIRAHYLYALGQRTPDVPVDGNHLSMRFMPKALSTVMPTLNGEEVRNVTESYDGPNGWLVQVVTDDAGAVAVFGDSLRSRIVTGTVEHWMDGVTVSPGTYTAPLLR
jgi:hypothetical protein